MNVTNMHQAKTHLSKLVDAALSGQEVIIGKAGKPLVRLVPFVKAKKKRRKSGYWKGKKIWISDDFDELPEDMLNLFYEGPIFPEETKIRNKK